jgi:hypothetical protein
MDLSCDYMRLQTVSEAYFLIADLMGIRNHFIANILLFTDLAHQELTSESES